MTLEEFLEHLEEIIRTDPKVKTVYIGGDVLRGYDGVCLECPITLVYKKLNNKDEPVFPLWKGAAEKLDLPYDVAKKIAATADNDGLFEYIDEGLREKLLDIWEVGDGKGISA